MKQRRFTLELLIFTLCLALQMLFISEPAQANDAQATLDNAPLAVVLLADTSTSMLTTDPDNLRYTALRSFIDSLGTNDYLSLITFDTEAEQLWPLTKLGNGNDRDELKDQLSTALVAGGDSDYLSAFKLARAELNNRPDGTRPLIIIITDGEPSPSWQDYDDPVIMRAYMDELKDETKALADRSYPIYSIGFSDDVNREVLDEMALVSRGQVILLDSPLRLELGLFHFLREVKNRTLVLEEDHMLTSSEASLSIPIPVDLHTSQVKLLLTHPDMSGLQIEVIAPEAVNQRSQSYMSEHEDYTLLVIEPASPGAAQGLWTVEVVGSGALGVYVDKDLHIKPLIQAPLTNTQQPSGEALNVAIEILGDSTMETGDADAYTLTAELSYPDGRTTIPLELVVEDGVYRGEIEMLSELGEYRITAALSLDEQVISTSTSSFRVKNLPRIQADLYTGPNPYRYGEEQVVTAQIRLNEVALKADPKLEVERFELVLLPEETNQEAFSAFFSNDGANGDAKAGDEHWTASLSFTGTGRYKAVVYLDAKLSNAAFSTTSELGSIIISAAGNINITADEAVWFKGRENSISLTVSNQSPFRQMISFDSLYDGRELLNPEHILEPEQSKIIQLQLGKPLNDETTVTQIELKVTAEDKDIQLEPNKLIVPISLVDRQAWLLSAFVEKLMPFIPVILIIVLGLIAFIAIGLVGYYRRLLPGRYLSGELSIAWHENDNLKPLSMNVSTHLSSTDGIVNEEAAVQKIDLSRLKKPQAKIVLGMNDSDVDISLPSSQQQITLNLERIYLPTKHRIMAGWSAFLGKYFESNDMIVQAEAPGFLQMDGKLVSRKVLRSGDSWQAGDMRFTYRNQSDENNEGKNILEDKL